MTDYFPYGKKEIEYLKKKDKKLGAIIDILGHPERPVIPDLFAGIVNAILSQQISTKAADTIWHRFKEAFSPVTPEHLLEIPDEAMQKCGSTFRKVTYIKNISRLAADGEISIEELSALPDEEFCIELTKLPGIGTWTAEMLLIHSLLRPNVLSYGDLAILRGLRMVYRHRTIRKDSLNDTGNAIPLMAPLPAFTCGVFLPASFPALPIRLSGKKAQLKTDSCQKFRPRGFRNHSDASPEKPESPPAGPAGKPAAPGSLPGHRPRSAGNPAYTTGRQRTGVPPYNPGGASIYVSCPRGKSAAYPAGSRHPCR